jgi:hypothetical protein
LQKRIIRIAVSPAAKAVDENDAVIAAVSFSAARLEPLWQDYF